jgi:oligopeptide/dipeptide ABC transporter ATP-binding protein
MSGEPLLRVEGLCKSYGSGKRRGRERESVRALDDVSLTIDRHETVALVGESGSGKSTLARVVTRLVEPDAGRVLLGDEPLLDLSRSELRVVRRRMQMVFQDPYSSLNPRRSIRSAIAEPALVHGRIARGEEQAFVERMLERVGLPAQVARRLPREMSGGQRQRVAIARALAVEPELLIADEAVSALDVSVQAQILNLFESLRDELGLTMLFISHQLPVVAHIADRVAVMYLGRIVEIGTPELLFASPRHPYTAALIAAQPGRHRAHARLAVAAARRAGELSPAELQRTGCAYRDRCALATEICGTERPPMATSDGDRQVACHHLDQAPVAVAAARDAAGLG